jgi:hypothetical protein
MSYIMKRKTKYSELDNSRHFPDLIDRQFLFTRGETMADMGSHQEGLHLAAEYKLENTSEGQGYLEANYSRGQGPMLAVASLKNL